LKAEIGSGVSARVSLYGSALLHEFTGAFLLT
jgi:hypothetical protein